MIKNEAVIRITESVIEISANKKENLDLPISFIASLNQKKGIIISIN